MTGAGRRNLGAPLGGAARRGCWPRLEAELEGFGAVDPSDAEDGWAFKTDGTEDGVSDAGEEEVAATEEDAAPEAGDPENGG